MKRTLLSFAAALLMAPVVAQAQLTESPLFAKGTKLLSLSVQTGGDYDATGFGAAFEYGVAPLGKTAMLGVGASIGYFSQSESYLTDKYSVKVMPVMLTGNLHFGLKDVPKLGLYGGASLGIIRASVDYSGPYGNLIDGSNSDSGFGIQAGGRYELSPKLMLHAQLGLIDLPLLTAGVSFKF